MKIYFIWLVVLIMIIFISINGKREVTSFYGIAETKEIIINSENSVNIKAIFVLPGQKVKKGQKIIELTRTDLAIRINETTHNIKTLKIESKYDQNTNLAQINQYKSLMATVKNEIVYQIEELEATKNVNKRLSKNISSLNRNKTKLNKENLENPIEIKINGLKKDLKLKTNYYQLMIDEITNRLNTPEKAIQSRLLSLEEELTLLQKENDKLIIYSEITGLVGSVNFKKGENVSSFTPIITIHVKSPSYVKGYIHENVYNNISLNDKVEILSVSNKKNSVKGEIIGVGSRIVEYPNRLLNRAEIQIWGREVMIKIPSENQFLLGEKLLIVPEKQKKVSIFGLKIVR